MKPAAVLTAIGLALAAASCTQEVETDQARICRMTAGGTVDAPTRIGDIKEKARADGRGLRLDYSEIDSEGATRLKFLLCTFARPGRPMRMDDLVEVGDANGPWSTSRLVFLIRFWLPTPEARAADPAPMGDLRGLPTLSFGAAYLAQQILNALPLCGVMGLLASAYALVYGLIGRINLAFGAFAAAGAYGATISLALAGSGPGATALLGAAAVAGAVGALWSRSAGALVFRPLRRASARNLLTATIGLALFLTEALRLLQGSRLAWTSPSFNRPLPLARSDDFVVATTPVALAVTAFAAGAAAFLVLLMRRSGFGRQWRASADDSFAAALFGVDPEAMLMRTLALGGALAGLAGGLLTILHGAVGFGAATSLGLKSLAAAILGGLGSVGGAFLGGVGVALAEGVWSAYFPWDYRDLAIYGAMALWLALRAGEVDGAALR